MAFAHGKDTHLTIDGDNVTIYGDTAAFDKSIDTAETSTFGSTDKSYVPGLRDGTLQVGGVYDPLLDGFAADWDDGAVVSCIYGPAGNTTGFVKYTFNALLTNYNISGGVQDKVAWTASLQKTGTATRGVY